MRLLTELLVAMNESCRASKPADNKTATKSRPGKRKGSPDSESDSEAVKPSATKSKARGKGAAKGKRAISDSEDEGSDAGPLGYASGDERLDDETDAPRAGSGKRADAAQKSKQQREADKKALEAMMDMDDDPGMFDALLTLWLSSTCNLIC